MPDSDIVESTSPDAVDLDDPNTSVLEYSGMGSMVSGIGDQMFGEDEEDTIKTDDVATKDVKESVSGTTTVPTMPPTPTQPSATPKPSTRAVTPNTPKHRRRRRRRRSPPPPPRPVQITLGERERRRQGRAAKKDVVEEDVPKKPYRPCWRTSTSAPRPKVEKETDEDVKADTAKSGKAKLEDEYLEDDSPDEGSDNALEDTDDSDEDELDEDDSDDWETEDDAETVPFANDYTTHWVYRYLFYGDGLAITMALCPIFLTHLLLRQESVQKVIAKTLGDKINMNILQLLISFLVSMWTYNTYTTNHVSSVVRETPDWIRTAVCPPVHIAILGAILFIALHQCGTITKKFIGVMVTIAYYAYDLTKRFLFNLPVPWRRVMNILRATKTFIVSHIPIIFTFGIHGIGTVFRGLMTYLIYVARQSLEIVRFFAEYSITSVFTIAMVVLHSFVTICVRSSSKLNDPGHSIVGMDKVMNVLQTQVDNFCELFPDAKMHIADTGLYMRVLRKFCAVENLAVGVDDAKPLVWELYNFMKYPLVITTFAAIAFKVVMKYLLIDPPMPTAMIRAKKPTSVGQEYAQALIIVSLFAVHVINRADTYQQ